ncbi:MAG: right-handed parallel beta-helix repeat-containing protein [Deltaproteobacteria bacterium]|nr:right-handed parallel beta-helix repeat-containing protein [Deltaproteobacteria bacterium]
MKHFVGMSVLWTVWLAISGDARADQPRAVATFHSIGLYWSPDGGGGDRHVLVRYREADTTVWLQGLPMRYNPISGTDEDLADYRGSLVHLRPGATYEIELSMDDGSEIATVTASTWPETFPISQTVQVPSGSDQFDITESGTPDGYILYDGTGSTIDVADQADYDISVDASYVIIRGFTLKGASRDGIRILGGHDITIEDCDISGWGRLDFDGDYGRNMDAAVFFSDTDVTRMVVQRCAMHHPRYDANSWAEYNCHSENSCSNHPAGPQAIVCYNSAGNHVFRYNKVWSDEDHYYNDIIGGGSNGSFVGFPGPDSDIYGNDLANCWDDGIEAEGGGRNVRIWANHVTDTYLAYANAAVSIGPWYFWRNVSGRCYSPEDSNPGTYGPFLKMGYAGSVDWMTGHMYLFHNTVWNADDEGCSGLGGSGRWIKHCVTRNNILHVRSEASRSIAIHDGNVDNDFDYDMYSADVPDGSETHGIEAIPTYVAGAGFDAATSTGKFQLQEGSAGQDGATALPNFDGYYLGPAPDMGAQETGSAPMVFGTQAGQPPQIETDNLPDAVAGRDYSFELAALGGRIPILWLVIGGELPDGMTLSRDGILSGRPAQPGTWLFSLYARNADSLLARADLSINVLDSGDCEDPLVPCGDECVDLSSDPQHCGSCDHACAEGEACVDSVCVTEGQDGGVGDGAVVDGSSESSGCGCAAGGMPSGAGIFGFLFVAGLLLLSLLRRRTSWRN